MKLLSLLFCLFEIVDYAPLLPMTTISHTCDSGKLPRINLTLCVVCPRLIEVLLHSDYGPDYHSTPVLHWIVSTAIPGVSPAVIFLAKEKLVLCNYQRTFLHL